MLDFFRAGQRQALAATDDTVDRGFVPAVSAKAQRLPNWLGDGSDLKRTQGLPRVLQDLGKTVGQQER